jgi:hypothetical protein
MHQPEVAVFDLGALTIVDPEGNELLIQSSHVFSTYNVRDGLPDFPGTNSKRKSVQIVAVAE